MATTDVSPKLLFVVTEDYYFCSHRLQLALAAIKAGFDVAVATRLTNHEDIIRQAGIKIYPWNVSRGSTNILRELKTVYGLFKIYKKMNPDLVHHVALKPVIYGSFIAKFIKLQGVVNALGGMGSLFSKNGLRRIRYLRWVVLMGLKSLLSSNKKDKVLILQNPDDKALMMNDLGVDEKAIQLIRGAGVDVQKFNLSAELDHLPFVILPARMLWDKGIGEYVDAIKILKAEGIQARFALVGGIDECNPTRISVEQLNAWVAEGFVEWLGMRNDMAEIFRQANVVCLPSYREGLPKSLLEAAACGRAIVTTDVPGCREIVRDGRNGILVPVRDPIALAKALKELILNPKLRRQMGRVGRKMVLSEFSEERVVKETISIYKKLARLE